MGGMDVSNSTGDPLGGDSVVERRVIRWVGMKAAQWGSVGKRIVAYFIMTALAMIGTGTLVGISVWQAAVMAGVSGCATVLEGLARAYVDDGVLTEDEVNAVFNAAPTKNGEK